MNAVPPNSASLIAALTGVLSDGGLLTEAEDLVRYSRDWSGDHFGRTTASGRRWRLTATRSSSRWSA